MRIATCLMLSLGLAAAHFEPEPSHHHSCDDLLQSARSAFRVGNKEMKSDLGLSGGWTMFHPTTEAIFDFFAYWHKEGKGISPEFLKSIFSYHFLPATVFSADIKEGDTFVPTFLQSAKYVNLGSGGRQVLHITKRNVTASQSASQSAIEVNHGVPGWPMATASVVLADVPCHNGVIHFVDKVLWFPKYSSALLQDGFAGAMKAALADSGTTTLVDTTANITVFVPMNQALESALGAGPLDPSALKDVIETHVTKGSLFSTALSAGQLEMFNGKKVTVELSNGDVFVGGAQVVVKNILLRNGVMHVIDRLLTPASTEPRVSV